MSEETNGEMNDGRMSFDEAVHFVQRQPGDAAFAAVPVFGERTDDEEQRAEGARVFILAGDGTGSYRLQFIAGPFFANAFAAHETMTADEIPDSVRELRFLPTRVEDAWLEEQVQILIQKLMQASGRMTPEMPDYASVPGQAAAPETVFPVSFIGRPESH